MPPLFSVPSGRDTSPEDVPSCACKMGLQAPAEGEECCKPPDSPSASSCVSASSGPLKDEPSSAWSTYEFLRFAGPGMLMMTAFIVCMPYWAGGWAGVHVV